MTARERLAAAEANLAPALRSLTRSQESLALEHVLEAAKNHERRLSALESAGKTKTKKKN
jgi:hypothetical protein